MTKAMSRPCMCCTHNSPGVPCAIGHRPRWYKDKGLRRVCKDFHLAEAVPIKGSKRFAFVEAIMRCFGLSR